MKALRRTLLVLGAIALLIATFYSFEGIRGMRAWRNTKARLESLGIATDYKSLVPPPVPDADNFAMTPLLAPLLDYTRGPGGPGGSSIVWRDPAAHRRITELNYRGSHKTLPTRTTSWGLGRTNDLDAWQAYYRGEPAFPSPPAPGNPAEDVLLALSKLDPEFKELRDAFRRPHAQFKIHREETYRALLPHLQILKMFAQASQLRASALLALNRADEALEELRLIVRIADALQDDLVLISGLVRIAILDSVVNTAWEGLAQRRWTDAQLREIERILGVLDMFSAYRKTMIGEHAWGAAAGDALRDNPHDAALEFASSGGDFSPAPFLIALVPYGWFEQNKATIANHHADFTLPIMDSTNRVFSMTAYRRAERAMNEMGDSFHVYRVIARMMLPATGRAAAKFARSQSSLDLARVACALERHWLKHGKYPDATAALAPEFIDKVPHDVMTGTPLKYRLRPDGRFTLYSIGFDERDDGGTVFLKNSGGSSPPTLDYDRGDWVWSYEDKGPLGPGK
jgi:hypothetical protein